MQQMFWALEMLKYVLSVEGVVTQTQDSGREEEGRGGEGCAGFPKPFLGDLDGLPHKSQPWMKVKGYLVFIF